MAKGLGACRCGSFSRLAGAAEPFCCGQLFRHLHDAGDQRSLDTNFASKSRNRGLTIVGCRRSVRLGQRVRNAARRISGELLHCSTRSVDRSDCQRRNIRRSEPRRSKRSTRHCLLGACRLFSWCREFWSDRARALAVLHGHSLLGVGWAMGLGRLGAIVGPLAIGLLVSRGWRIGDTFAALGMPALCGALFTSLIAINRPPGTAAADRVATDAGEEL